MQPCLGKLPLSTLRRAKVLVFISLLQAGEGRKQGSRWEKRRKGQSQYAESDLSVLSSSSFQRSLKSSFIFLAVGSLIKDMLGAVFTVFLIRNQTKILFFQKYMQDFESHILEMLNTRMCLPFYWCYFKCSACLHWCMLWHGWLCHDNQVLINSCLQSIEIALFQQKYIYGRIYLCVISLVPWRVRQNIVKVSSNPLQQTLFP